MHCPQCGHSNPEDARFCIYCAAQLVPAQPAEPTQPATGPTTRLEQAEYVPPASDPAPPATPSASPSVGTRGWGKNREKEMNSMLWLIGLGVLFLTGSFWPGILVLVGLSSYVHSIAHGHQQKALRDCIFFTGLAVLFWVNLFWPGILILIGITTLLSPELSRSTS